MRFLFLIILINLNFSNLIHSQSKVEWIELDNNTKLSNNGKNVNDIFTNKFYINDHMQDKQIVEEINS